MSLEGKKVLVLAANSVDEKEYLYPSIRLAEEGAEVVTAGPKAGPVAGNHGMETLTVDVAIDGLKAADFDGVVIPGGFAPDLLRRDEYLLDLIRDMNEANKTVAFICHAGWVPVSAGILDGRKVTSVGAIKHDLINAGGDWSDEEVVVDKNLVSSRTPADLGPFMKAVIKNLSD